jgi:hypothetical protein
MDEGGRTLFDSVLVHVDGLFLKWIFPEGQLALWAQDNPYVTPESFLGRCITEVHISHFSKLFGQHFFLLLKFLNWGGYFFNLFVGFVQVLQLGYFSYYFWGNCLLVWMLYKILIGDSRHSFTHVRMFLNGWVRKLNIFFFFFVVEAKSLIFIDCFA